MHYISLLLLIFIITSCSTIESAFIRIYGCSDITTINSELDGDNEIEFSHTRGFYDRSFDLTLNPTLEGTLYYTTNGALPTPENATRYFFPIRIRNSSSIRAAMPSVTSS